MIALTALSGRPGHEAGQHLAHRGFGQRLEVDRGEVALAGAPVGPPLEQLRPGEGHDVDRVGARPLEDVVDEVDQARVRVVEVLEDQDHRRRRGEALEERPPGADELLRRDARLDAEQGQEGGLDPAPLLLVLDDLADLLGDLLAGRCLVVGLAQAAAGADHLAQRPEADPVAVGRAAALVPPDRVGQAVDVLEELPGQPGLAEAGRADDADEAGAALAGRGVEHVLEEPELLVAADERGLERVLAVATAGLGHDPGRAPGLDRRLLALEVLLAGLLEGDRLAGGALGRLADEDRARLGDALESRRGVDEVAGDHALVRGAEGDGGFAGQDAGPGLDSWSQRLDGVDELEAGPDGPLGVVLAGDGGAPDRHDGVADELLDGAAVAADHLAGELEVAVQELAGVLGVLALGERREADEIGEQDRDEAALGDGCRPVSSRLIAAASTAARPQLCRGQRRGALTAERVARFVGGAAHGADDRERRRALRAELPAGSVLGTAVGADHDRSVAESVDGNEPEPSNRLAPSTARGW